MSDHYNYDYGAPSGASFSPTGTTDQQDHAQGHAAAPVSDNKPYSLSPGGGFESSRGAKGNEDEVPATTTLCANPDGSFNEVTTVGQDKAGKDHPFMTKTSTFTASDGSTIINRRELHWTIKPSKDGKTRTVDYTVMLDRRMYDRYGRATFSSHQGPLHGTFKNDGQALPFEQPVRCEWSSRDTAPSSDEQSKKRDSHRHARSRA